MAAILCLFMGQFALFTYLRPFLEQVTHVEVSTLSLLLLVMGVSGLVGTLLIGSLLQHSFQPVLVVIPLLMSGIAIALIAFGSSLTATALLLAAWGLLGTPAPVGWGTWLSRTLPRDAEAGGGLMVATIQLAITLGASAGGVAFDSSGYEATFALSAIVLVGARVICKELPEAPRRSTALQGASGSLRAVDGTFGELPEASAPLWGSRVRRYPRSANHSTNGPTDNAASASLSQSGRRGRRVAESVLCTFFGTPRSTSDRMKK